MGEFSGNRSVGKINQILYDVYTVFSSSGFFLIEKKTRRKGRCKHLKEVIRRGILEEKKRVFPYVIHTFLFYLVHNFDYIRNE